MRRRTLLRLWALPSLVFFVQAAALSPIVHACCMEMGADGHASHGEAASGHHATGHAHGTDGQDAGGHHVHVASSDADGNADEDVCCFGGCDCCFGSGSLAAPRLAELRGFAPTAGGVELRPDAVAVQRGDLLLPYPNAPPQVAIQSV